MERGRLQLPQAALLALAAFTVATCLWLQLSQDAARMRAEAWAEGGRCGSGARPHSLCSDRASARGPGQRVVAFAAYGDPDNPRLYFQGVDSNAEAAARFYPGWLLRVYHNTSAGSATRRLLEDAEARHEILDLCAVDALPCGLSTQHHRPMVWRFLPMSDPLVDVFVSRDLDSEFSGREAAAVAEWLASNLSFHSMRDHPRHGVPLLGGMWGARMGLEREQIRELGEKMERRATLATRAEDDQKILAAVVWPAISGRVLQHDSYTCRRFASHGNMRPWPTRRTNDSYNFVGFAVGLNAEPMTKTCPPECRPPDRQDWTTC